MAVPRFFVPSLYAAARTGDFGAHTVQHMSQFTLGLTDPNKIATIAGAELAARLLAKADVRIEGSRPWDLRVRNPAVLSRILRQGSLGLGEAYMDGWWECDRIDEFIARVLTAKLDREAAHAGVVSLMLKARLLNPQAGRRAWQVGLQHYDLGNDLYRAMLDPYLAYSCGYWANADDLEHAQLEKLELICRKLGLQSGMRLLDIGCGFGSLMRYAAERHGVQCTGLTISAQQATLGAQLARDWPVRFELTDYRDFNRDAKLKFDRVVSVGMFEHVGPKNHRAFFDVASRSLLPTGLMLLHTIGRDRSGTGVDPWIDRYIFPNSVLPSMQEIVKACEPEFVVEDWHNFGADYDRTLLAWHERFESAWPQLRARYDERFHRMWRYYLLSCAGSFRARSNQLWQIVLSPEGVRGGYRAPR